MRGTRYVPQTFWTRACGHAAMHQIEGYITSKLGPCMPGPQALHVVSNFSRPPRTFFLPDEGWQNEEKRTVRALPLFLLLFLSQSCSARTIATSGVQCCNIVI